MPTTKKTKTKTTKSDASTSSPTDADQQVFTKADTTKAQLQRKQGAQTKTSKNAPSPSPVTIVGRQELIKRVATHSQLTQKQAAQALETTLDVIQESLQAGNEVRLVGFGSFKVRRSTARKGVNPRTREAIEVPAKDRVRFAPGKELSDAVVKK
ncbi:MAG: hypothetical protein NVSMB49_00930 [Ktedonobacteraceae bacterium]